ncbi:DHA2 family efflux MFS transporter permease subunit [Pelotomaculum terephthalicicum JT]|uniref:DHA2 family efflux MFS transporter permease subunit n=1 Tax=Pelotomaculum terephthalicicum TaxID=206393 RepID=UPI0009CEB84B|nr:DHA2 family efflux MFS transporter permease subunit [Pelotomaculum terephthalicicum]MCG9967158.1 DHA2 family efflux MFS transporter permease subunit [Pelotomaculum terephthalicicum JT]OPY60013.1 MAG: Multidrug export protein EmrB [Pelotomaculum sp. PtaU1.Bin065]
MNTGELQDRINWSATSVIIMGTFLQGLTGNIVNVAISKLMAVFGTNANDIQWVLTAYMLTQGIVIALAGYLGDKFGYKKTFVVALALFTLGSFLCGTSFNFNMMIVSRVLQGMGAGIIMPLGMAICFRINPISRIGMVLGVWGIAGMATMAIGPSLGGYLIEAASWRTLFYINVPVGLLAIFMGIALLPETEKNSTSTLDTAGIATICVGLFCLIFALSKGNQMGWGDPVIVVMLFIGIVNLLVMVVHELRCPEPVLDMRLFKNKLFTLSTIISSFIQVALIVTVYLFPLLMQSVLGQTAMQTGLVLLPSALVTAIFMPIGGRLFDKYGARYLILIGVVIMTGASYAMKDFNASTSFNTMMFWLTIRGIGLGLALAPAINVGMVGIPKESTGTASSLGNVIRSVASTFGIAIITNLMQTRNTFHYANLAQNVVLDKPDGLNMVSALQGIGLNAGLGAQGGQILSLSVLYKYVAQQSMVMAISDCFIIGAVLCGIAFIITLFLHDRKNPDLPLRKF